MKNRSIFALVALLCTKLLSSGATLAQFSQQGPKLVGIGELGLEQQGCSVSLSADGSTAIVGGNQDSGHGAAWVWTRSGGIWTQQGNKLAGTGFDQGSSVSLSADGNTAIVGAPGFSGGVQVAGSAAVWIRSGGVWSQQGDPLVGSGATGGTGGADQGVSVSLSADGNTAIVGGYRDNVETGAAWVWTRSGGVWTQQGGKLVASDGATARQGRSVCLSADGNTAIVGGYRDNGDVGAAWIWTRSGGIWTQQGNKLVGSGAVGGSAQGFSVSLSADGNTAIVAGPGDNGLTGAAWIWIRGGGVWTQQGNKLIGLGAVGNATQGNSVSLSADGNTAVVGGPSDDGGNGAAWIWTRNAGIWNQLGSKLVGLGAVPGDGFNPSQGVSVAFSADGKTVLVGGYHDEGGFPGASWVFVPAPDLDITKSAIGGPVFLAGGDINYTTSVVNNGPGNANDVVVTDVLPVGTTFVSSTPSQGSCSGTSTVSCTLGALANGGSATISLVIKTASTPGPVSNTATVVAAEVDLNPANNSSTSTINTVDPTSVPAASVWLLIALAGMLAQLGGMRIR